MNAMTAPETDGPRAWVRIVRAMILLVVMVFITGMLVGFVDAHHDEGGGPYSARALAVMGGIGLAGLIALGQMLRDLYALLSQIKQLPRRERVSVQLLTGAIGVGLMAGVASGIAGVVVDDSTRIAPAAAIGIAMVLLVLGSWISWRWWLAVDEHERAAYVLGANISAHFVLTAGIIWWVLSLSGIVPPPDAISLIVAMSLVWTGVWFWRKYF